MPLTDKREYRYPAGGASPDLAAHLRALAADLDADVDSLAADQATLRTDHENLKKRDFNAVQEVLAATRALEKVSGDSAAAARSAAAAAVSAELSKNGAQANDTGVAGFVAEGAKTRPALLSLIATATAAMASQLQQLRDKGTPPAGVVRIDSFPGATGADQLRAAMAYAQAQTRKPALMVTPGAEYHAGSTPFEIYDGFRLVGPSGGETEFAYGTKVLVRGTPGVFALKPSGLTRGVSFENISFEGLPTTNFIVSKPADNSLGSLAYSQFDSVSFNNFKTIYHGPLTGVTWRGQSYIQNIADTALYLNGSDCHLFTDGLFVDQAAGTTWEGRAAGEGLIRLENLSKSTVGALYVTGDPGLCLKVGGEGTHALIIQGARLEGRNWSKPAAGAIIRMSGGVVTFRDVWTSYGMGSPSSTGRSELGIIQVWGGHALIDGGMYERAQGVAESVPYIVAAGTAKVTVRNIRGYKFTGKPVVLNMGATVDADSSVTVQNS